MQSLTRQPKEDNRPDHKQINRSKPLTYGEAHIMIGVRSTVVEFRLEPNGSGFLVVKRDGVEISQVRWEPEKIEVVGLTQREREAI